MTTTTTLLILLALLTKHWICDFCLQTHWQLSHKGTYGHLGGIVHASIASLGTVIALCSVLPYAHVILGIALLEGICHYHIDWAKANLTLKWNLVPNKDYFWWLLGFDQWAHNVNYLAIISWLLIAQSYGLLTF